MPDDPDGGALARWWHRRQHRRAATKARIAAMTRGRRVARRSMIIGTWLLGLLAALMVTTIVLFYTLTDVPRPTDLPLPQVATIQYADGSTLAKIGSVDRTIVRLDQVPKSVRWAVIAAEDRGFYSEPGVSLKGTVRAALSDLKGGDTQGGSGITQQYVKNAYLSNAQTLSRKLKELMIAVKLSREYSKDQILEFYLNTVYFGRNTYGIEAAAQAYFGKDVQKLTTAEGALLAGVLRAPGYYDPAANRVAAKERWTYVLDGMVQTKHMTAEQEAAMTFPKTKAPTGTELGTTGWRYLLVNAVLADLESHGISTSVVYAKGLTIRTTIDRKAQNAAVSAIRTTFKDLTKKQRNLKNALVAFDPSDGGVLAYYGGSGPGVKGYDGKVDYNDYASRGARPPGSSFKPYTLATALTQTIKQTEGKPHYTINSLVDGSYCREVEGTTICNDPGDKSVSARQVTIRHAMKYSLNTTFDLMASEAGPSDVATTAHAMGISAKNNQGKPTLVNPDGTTSFGIGIGDYAVSVQDQATGFATLQNGGVTNKAYLVTRATGSDGEVVYTHKASPTRAIDKRVANDVTLTLEPVAASSGNGLALDGGRLSAAKTGTEGIGGTSLNNSDAWMVGYTPQVSTAVWVGTGLSTPIFNASGDPEYGSDLPGRTWKLFMDTYLDGTKKLAMAKTVQVASNGKTPVRSPTSTAASTTAASTTAAPTVSVTTTVSSSTAASTGPPPTSPPPSTSLPPSTSAPATSSSPTCGPGLPQPACPSSTATTTAPPGG